MIYTDQQHTTSPGQVAGPSTWVGAGALGGVPNSRTYQQIIAEEKQNRNIIEFQIVKSAPTGSNEEHFARSLTYDELGELIFDVMKIDPSDCITFDYNTGRNDTKQIQLKSSVNSDQYVTTNPIPFKGYEVSVRKQLNNIRRVKFKMSQ